MLGGSLIGDNNFVSSIDNPFGWPHTNPNRQRQHFQSNRKEQPKTIGTFIKKQLKTFSEIKHGKVTVWLNAISLQMCCEILEVITGRTNDSFLRIALDLITMCAQRLKKPISQLEHLEPTARRRNNRLRAIDIEKISICSSQLPRPVKDIPWKTCH